MMRHTLWLLTTLLFSCPALFALAPTNFYRPWDVNLLTEYWPREKGYKKIKFSTQVEYGDTDDGWNFSNDKSGVLRIYNETQSAIAATFGAQPCSELDDLASCLSSPGTVVTDDGCRGRFRVDGRYRELDVNFHAQYNFAVGGIDGFFDLSVYVPYVKKRISNVKWVDLTNGKTCGDLVVRDVLTRDIDELAARLGDGLQLRDFETEGLSDPVLMLRWFNDYEQPDRKNLKKVRLSGRVGYVFPLTPKREEDHALAVPRGFDGAAAMPITVGLDLFFKHNIRFISEFEVLKIFDDVRTMRLKTDPRQTDFLLFHKGTVRKKFGTTWKFNLGLRAEHFLGGLSAMIAYRYQRHDADRLTARSNFFSNDIINSAQSLRDWTFHNVVFQLSYDLFDEAKHVPIKSQFSVFYKLPLGGRRVINADTIGGQFTLNF